MIGLANIAVAIPTERTEVMMMESIPAKSEYNVGGIVVAGTIQDGVGHRLDRVLSCSNGFTSRASFCPLKV